MRLKEKKRVLLISAQKLRKFLEITNDYILVFNPASKVFSKDCIGNHQPQTSCRGIWYPWNGHHKSLLNKVPMSKILIVFSLLFCFVNARMRLCAPQTVRFGVRICAFALLTALTVGCAGITAVPEKQRQVQSMDAAQMLEIVQRAYSYTSLQALARVHFERGSEKHKSTQAIHVRAPYQLRAEVYNFMGQMLALLAADRASLEAYVPGHKVLYRGMATRDRMERFAFVPLMPVDMVALLLQRLPPGVLELAQVQKGEGNRLRFILSHQQEYVVDFVAGQISTITYLEMGEERLRIAYADAQPTDDPDVDLFPRRMILTMPAQELKLDILLEDVQMNPALEAHLFEIEPRSGVQIRSLEEL
jgi:hypothetical protein